VVSTLRFRSKPLAALSILLVLVGALGGSHAPDDVDEYSATATNPRTSHEMRATSQTMPTAPEHCALCHWLQALGKAAPVATQVLAGDSFQRVQATAFIERVCTTSLLCLPSRAPPLA
jgi:hypothetical protein